MALTKEQKNELEEVLKRTGAHREAGAIKKGKESLLWKPMKKFLKR